MYTYASPEKTRPGDVCVCRSKVETSLSYRWLCWLNTQFIAPEALC